MADTTSKSPWWAWALAGLVALGLVAGIAGAVDLLEARAEAEPDAEARPALTVATVPLALVDQYEATESFAGRIEPARETMQAAERGGLLTQMLVEEGDLVTEGQVIARLDTRSLEISATRLRAERASLEAEIALAETTTNRRAQLVGDGWASGQAYDEARFSISTLAARRDAVEAQLAQVALDLEKSEIIAPFAGRIAARMADEGTVVAPGTALVRLQETGRPRARIGVPTDRAPGLAMGQKVRLTSPDGPLTGRILAVNTDLQTRTRTVPVLVELAEDDPLAMGQIVRLSLSRVVEARGAWIALSALTEAERGLWSIMTVAERDGAPHVVRELVEILSVQDERAFVRGTFADGALVVETGAHRIGQGQTVALTGPEG